MVALRSSNAATAGRRRPRSLRLAQTCSRSDTPTPQTRRTSASDPEHADRPAAAATSSAVMHRADEQSVHGSGSQRTVEEGALRQGEQEDRRRGHHDGSREHQRVERRFQCREAAQARGRPSTSARARATGWARRRWTSGRRRQGRRPRTPSGQDRGTATRRHVRNGDSPSTWAASNSDRGSRDSARANSRTKSGVVAISAGAATVSVWSVSPSWSRMTVRGTQSALSRDHHRQDAQRRPAPGGSAARPSRSRSPPRDASTTVTGTATATTASEFTSCLISGTTVVAST